MSVTRADTWMPIYWGDYLRDTMHLRADGHGAYLLLIAHYWVTGAPLPANDDYLMAVARLEAKSWRKLKPMLAAFFTVTEREWIHPRIDRELAKAVEITEKRRTAGHASANARANARTSVEQTGQQTGQQNARHSQSHSPSQEFINSNSEGRRLLNMATIEKARERFPGYDMNHCENRFWELNAGKHVVNTDAAFLGFMKVHAERNPLQ